MSRRNIGVWITILALGVAIGGARDARAEEATGQPSLYERLGGLAPISVVVDDLIDALVPDEELNRNQEIDASRTRVPAPYLKYHVTAMVCQATGGPCTYHGRGMKESHAHLNISCAEWDHMVTVFKGILAKHGVPDAEAGELLAIVASTRADIVSR
jgi:hemoglobin